MTDLPKRLEAAGRKEAENLYPCGHDFKMRLSGLSSCGCCLSTLSDYRARASLHPLIQKMAEALEKIKEIKSIAGKPHTYDESQHTDYCVENGCYGHWKESEYPEDIANKALADLEKYLEGKK